MARWGRCDFRQLKRLQKDLESIQKIDLDKYSQQAVYELAARLLRKVKNRTPVDTGELRRNWFIGGTHKHGDYYTIEVYNQVEYASYVEYGHRTPNHSGWVLGVFMLTISEKELQKEGEKILERKFERLLRGALDGR